MSDLLAFKAKICLTAAGILIFQHKVLLVKHKKLGIWLAPGGHLEDNELPHQAAAREFWEETGVKVKAFDPLILPQLDGSQNVPNPIWCNLHWISQENYWQRLSREKNRPVSSSIPPAVSNSKPKKTCEQHLTFIYLVKPLAGVKYQQNIEETDGIAWFTEQEIDQLETAENIKQELHHAFSLKLDGRALSKQVN